MNPPSEFDNDEAPRLAERPDERSWPERCSILFEDLRRPARAMIARAYGKSISDEEIDDIYSSAWTATLSALRHRGAEMGDAELRAYVLTAVASHASKELRRRSRKPIGLLSEAHEQVIADHSQPLPEERAIGSESQSIARDLLSSLPARRRAVMLLRYGWGLSPDEVCALVSGLSRRAYRKEVTRGVGELLERLQEIESGSWCQSRQPMLREYLAGTADEATRRQVEEHMRHCRACAALAARMRSELNDLGGVVLLGAAAGLIAGPRVWAIERVTNLFGSARDGVVAVTEKAEFTAGAVAMSGGVRGAGTAGAGVAAKVAALGGAGKAALACIGAGAAATACVAAGVIPGVTLNGFGAGDDSAAKQAPVVERADPRRRLREGDAARVSASSTPTAANVDPPAPSPTGPAEVAPEPAGGAPAVPVPAPVAPAPQPVPAAPAIPAPQPPAPSDPSGGAGSIAGEEFGP